MVTVGILVHNAGKLVRIIIKVNPQDVEVASPNPKLKVSCQIHLIDTI